MDSELFMGWFYNHFLFHVPAARSILLLDGHYSHFNPAVIRVAMEEEVVIFCLPLKTTHLLQPLDKGCFAALKEAWNQECHKFTTRSFEVVSRSNFSEIFRRAWQKAVVPRNISASFRITGVYPLNRHAVTGAWEASLDDVDTRPPLFIPMITPSKVPVRDDLKSSLCCPALRSSHFQNVFRKSPEPFTADAEGQKKFEERYTNGYDLEIDGRYNAWLLHYHPHSPVVSRRMPYALQGQKISLKKRVIAPTSLGEKPKTFQFPPLPSVTRAKGRSKQKVTARVVTLAETLRDLEDKQKKKQEEILKKEERKREREKKKKQREEAAAKASAKGSHLHYQTMNLMNMENRKHRVERKCHLKQEKIKTIAQGSGHPQAALTVNQILTSP
eukprot:m.22110 g.22110  ORF g.22110 m.22110 type:complete len:386 (+) comp28285_c0_seq1:922-2079(+)